MRKLAAIVMTMGIIIVAFAGPASAGRIAQDSYGTPAVGQGDLVSLCLSADPPADSCVAFPVNLGESSVSVTITDASGQPTYATIGQDFNDDGLTDVSANFCGSIANFPVQPPNLGTYEVIIFPHAGPGLGDDLASPCAGVGTSGVVTADFS